MISTLEEQKSELEKGRDLALEQKRKATEEMKAYSDVKQELAQHDISVTKDIQISTCNFTPKMTNTNLWGSIIDCYRVEADLDIH